MNIKSTLQKLLRSKGYALRRARRDGLPIDFTDEASELVSRVKGFTMTREERILGLQRAVGYVCDNKIKGDFVECGVWKGGSSMVAAIEFLKRGDLRDLYLLDSYDLPIPAPLQVDKGVYGEKVFGGATEAQPYWQAGSVEEVRGNLRSTGYPEEKIKMVRGLVTDTIPDKTPEVISILRLDTDTYESAKFEIEQLYPKLSLNGVLIVDDYGSHAGVQKAVEDYFEKAGRRPLITRLDTAGVIAIKI